MLQRRSLLQGAAAVPALAAMPALACAPAIPVRDHGRLKAFWAWLEAAGPTLPRDPGAAEARIREGIAEHLGSLPATFTRDGLGSAATVHAFEGVEFEPSGRFAQALFDVEVRTRIGTPGEAVERYRHGHPVRLAVRA